MKIAALMMARMAATGRHSATSSNQPGLIIKNQSTVSAHGFVGAARIIERFDELASQIEAEQP